MGGGGCGKQNGMGTHPAIPIDWGSCSDALRVSQYAGVTRSIPNRMPTKMSVGVKRSLSAIATFRKLSS